jgi:hypothetical protein
VTIDHKALLDKYMRFIGDSEGTDFVNDYYFIGYVSKLYGPFTEEEIAELKEARRRSNPEAMHDDL